MISKLKFLFSPLVALSICLNTFGQNEKKVKLTIYSPNSPDYTFEVSTPLDGNYFEANSQLYQLDKENAKKTVDLNIDGEQLISVRSNWSQVKLIVRPGDQIDVSFFKRDSVLIAGSHAEGQLLFNKIVKDDAWRRCEELDVYPTVEGRLRLLDSMQQADFVAINNLLKGKKINESFAERMKQESIMYYKLLWSTDLSIVCHPLLSGPPELAAKVDSSFLEAWKMVYQDVTTDWIKSSFFFELSERYGRLLSISNKAKYKESYALNFIAFLKSVLKDELLEYAWAGLMLEGANNNENQLIWLENFKEFKTRYPNSRLSPILAPSIEKIKQYHANSSADSPDIEILDIENYNSLATLMQGLKGRWYYVDVWATWCTPCKEELQYSIKIHDELEQIGFTPFYLSIDKENASSKWLEMVKGYPLKGVNARTGDALRESSQKELPNYRGIPQYLIVNDKGEIVNWDAKRPSDGRELIKQLQSYKKGV